MKIFEAKEVTKNFAAVQALDRVSIEVAENSIFGLLGPNGAGKTTLIRIINQITAPDSGEILLNGKKMNRADIAHIGYLPEERGLYKKMKVGEQAIYLARLKGMTRSDAVKELRGWFEKFDIMPWWNKKVEELSKGMQQKVQFITTVVHKPRLLIFDEPFSGFDPINANLLKQEILQIRNRGATILFSTHNMESVEELCDSIALINKAVKIEDGPTAEIREKYKSNVFNVRFTGELDASRLAKEEGFRILKSWEANGESLLSVKNREGMTSNDLIRLFLPLVEIKAFEEIIPGMNEVFIRAVEKSNNQETKQD